MENEIIKDFDQFIEYYGVEELINRFEEDVLSLNNDQLSLYFSKLDGSDLKRHGDIILKNKNIDTICDFCITHSFEDASEHVQMLWDSGEVSSILKYTDSVYEECFSHISKEEMIPYSGLLKMRRSFEKVLSTGNANDCMEFLRWFQKKSNIVRDDIDYGYQILSTFHDLVDIAEQIILDSNNSHTNYECVKVMNSLPRWAYDTIHYKNHSQVILDNRDLHDNYLFAKEYGHCKGVSVIKHGTIILEDGDSTYNYLFARDVEGADKRRHGDFVIRGGNSTYNYLFARDVEDADILKHGKVVLEDGDPRFNYLFIPGSDSFEHEKVLAKDSYYGELLSLLDLPRKENVDRENCALNIRKKIKKMKKV